MEVFEATILHHVCIVLSLLWLLSCFNCSRPVFYFVSLIYLYLVHERYEMRLRRKLQFEERMQSNQRRVLTDSESVRWLNHLVEKIWPVCMEQIVSQKILLPIIPWFLDKYKPWTVKKSVVEHLYMGRSPPMFTDMRVLRQSTGDDHLVLELGMNFRTADDMSAILAVKLTKRLGFGMRTKLHLKGLHVEGKVLIGVKFVRHWPFLGRVRLCFVEPPYFQMTVKPIFTHGLDVTELPGIAGWLDKLLALAFEQTLVEPNMLVVDVEKFASPQPENWFCIDEKESIAYALVEVIEGADMKPSDLNGLADPYVKGQLGPYRFRTKTQWKTLAPKWHEEFKVPICTWESPNVLAIEVRDKDQFMDDTLGDCSVNISDLRGGQRHELWLSLRNIKMGRLHLAVTVVEGKKKVPDLPCDDAILNDDNKSNSIANESAKTGSLSSGGLEKSPNVVDKFEPIDIEGQKETGIWVHHPGSEVSQIWEPRKGRSRVLDSQVLGNGGNLKLPSASASYNNDNSSTDGGSQEGKKGILRKDKVLRGLKKIGTVFSKNSKKEDMSCRIEGPIPSQHPNLKAINERKSHVKLIVEEDNLSAPSLVNVPISEGKVGPEGSSQESRSKAHVKDMAKNILKNAGNSARGVKHAFDRKGPKKSQGDLGLVVTNRDISAGSESSDEESPASSVCTSEGNPVIPKALSSCGNDSFKSEELHDQNTPFDFPINKDGLDGTEKISCAWPGNEKIGDDYRSTMTEESNDLLN
ncbi:C2 domain-containing protein At1g53590 [Rhododendron vialii]|uniref:C2 domain-containing protein At1g53590 n=1 Tax=Rhododendron vialii TaxID=182163 RepID=UPI00265DD733|nr:C2 domain-containing protein At1g53590 [Rhododendron vialii]